jgi:hypothetical protein
MLKSIIKNNLFCYAIADTALTTGQTLVPQISINNDSDFEVLELRGVVMLPATSINAVTATIMMQASLSSGELFSNNALNILSFVAVQNVLAANNTGNYTGYPIRLPVPQAGMILPANSQINVSLTNNTSGTIRVQIQYWGRKVPQGSAAIQGT